MIVTKYVGEAFFHKENKWSSQVLNMKILSNIYLKTLWVKSNDTVQSISDLEKIADLTTHLFGTSTSFRHSKICMEIGETYSINEDKGRAGEALEEGR